MYEQLTEMTDWFIAGFIGVCFWAVIATYLAAKKNKK